MTKTIAMDIQLTNFSEAFDSRTGTSRATCECGKEYWDNVNSGMDWEPGEIERLANDKNAFAAGGSISFVEFEGRNYVYVCDCWHKRAGVIIKFLAGHREGIINFFKLEKERLEREAKTYDTGE